MPARYKSEPGFWLCKGTFFKRRRQTSPLYFGTFYKPLIYIVAVSKIISNFAKNMRRAYGHLSDIAYD